MKTAEKGAIAFVTVAVAALLVFSRVKPLRIKTGLTFPLPSRRLTSAYGVVRADHVHQGADYSAPVGTPLRAPEAGNVFWFDGARSGLALVLEGQSGVVHTLMHLSSRVAQGPVQAGQLLAYTGQSGKGVTGPHLHYEMTFQGAHLDPERVYGNV